MYIFSNLKNADQKFLSQAADPQLRKRRIAQLTFLRQMARPAAAITLVSVVVQGGFALIFCYRAIASSTPHAQHDFESGELTWVFWVAFYLLFMQGFNLLQNELRLLLLAEQLDARQNNAPPSAVIATAK